MQRSLRILAVVGTVVMLAGACGGDDNGGAVEPPKDESTTATATTAAAKAPSFPAGSTMATLQQKGKIVVGVKFDQPGFGFQTPSGVVGFDAEMAKIVAAALFGGKLADAAKQIEFVESKTPVREQFIEQGKVDIVVATYTINDARKLVVDFAGPYWISHQDIMVKSDNTTIKAVKDLNGKRVCSVQGSTSLKNLSAQAPQAKTDITFDAYSKCAEAMGDGRVDAVTTDDSILAGLAKDSGGAFKLVGAPFTDEPYGIGLKKGDQAFRDFLNSTIEKSYSDGSWAAAFDTTLGSIGLTRPTPPPVVRY